MFYVSREFVIPANLDEILKFLEEDNHLLPSSYYFSDLRDFTADYRCRRDGNKISVYRYAYFTPSGELAPKDYLDDPSGPGYEIIRFEITQFFNNRSNVKGMYDSFDPETDDPNIKKMFLTMVVRLADSAGAESLAISAQRELNELNDEVTRKSGMHWGLTEWKDGPTPGSKMRVFGLIPNVPSPVKNKPPRIPKRRKELETWRLRWRAIGEMWQMGHFETYQACIDFLEKYHKRLACKDDVLADTIAAGMAGLLDLPETS